jgi:hypothetical protein
MHEIKAGSCVSVYARSGVAGRLVLFKLDADRKGTHIFGKGPPRRVEAGEFAIASDRRDDFEFGVAGPWVEARSSPSSCPRGRTWTVP